MKKIIVWCVLDSYNYIHVLNIEKEKNKLFELIEELEKTQHLFSKNNIQIPSKEEIIIMDTPTLTALLVSVSKIKGLPKVLYINI